MCSNARFKTRMSLPDCFIDDHLVEMFSFFDKTRLQLGCSTHAPATSPGFGSLRDCGQNCWLARVGAMKPVFHGFNSCTVFTCPMGKSNVLSANVTSVPVTALINIKETDIFVVDRHIQNLVHKTSLGHFYPILSQVYFFPNSVQQVSNIAAQNID